MSVAAETEVEAGAGLVRFAVTASDITGEARDRWYRRLALRRPAFAGYEVRTDRVIPMVRLRPDLAHLL